VNEIGTNMKLLKPMLLVLGATASMSHAAIVNLSESSIFDTSDVDYYTLQADCGGGYTCFTDAASLGNGGGSDHFDDAMGVALNDNAYGVSSGDWDGTSLTLSTVSFGNIEMYVEFMGSGPLMRQIVTLTNTGVNTESANVSWQNNTGNDANQRTIATGSGDLTETADDRWIVTADSNSGIKSEVNSWVFSGPDANALVPTSISMTDLSNTFGSTGDQGFSALFDFDLLAGETASLMFFVGIEGINQDGIDLAGNFNDTSSTFFQNLTTDLSAQDFSQIRNWNPAVSVPEPATLAIMALGLFGIRFKQKRK
jgi:hypothetical protein